MERWASIDLSSDLPTAHDVTGARLQHFRLSGAPPTPPSPLSPFISTPSSARCLQLSAPPLVSLHALARSAHAFQQSVGRSGSIAAAVDAPAAASGAVLFCRLVLRVAGVQWRTGRWEGGRGPAGGSDRPLPPLDCHRRTRPPAGRRGRGNEGGGGRSFGAFHAPTDGVRPLGRLGPARRGRQRRVGARERKRSRGGRPLHLQLPPSLRPSPLPRAAARNLRLFRCSPLLPPPLGLRPHVRLSLLRLLRDRSVLRLLRLCAALRRLCGGVSGGGRRVGLRGGQRRRWRAAPAGYGHDRGGGRGREHRRKRGGRRGPPEGRPPSEERRSLRRPIAAERAQRRRRLRRRGRRTPSPRPLLRLRPPLLLLPSLLPPVAPSAASLPRARLLPLRLSALLPRPAVPSPVLRWVGLPGGLCASFTAVAVRRVGRSGRGGRWLVPVPSAVVCLPLRVQLPHLVPRPAGLRVLRCAAERRLRAGEGRVGAVLRPLPRPGQRRPRPLRPHRPPVLPRSPPAGAAAAGADGGGGRRQSGSCAGRGGGDRQWSGDSGRLRAAQSARVVSLLLFPRPQRRGLFRQGGRRPSVLSFGSGPTSPLSVQRPPGRCPRHGGLHSASCAPAGLR